MSGKFGDGSSWFMPIAAFVPTQILAWLNMWLGVLERTGLAHPHWRQVARYETLAISTLLVVIIFIVLRRRRELVLRKTAIVAFTLSVVALAFCALVKHLTKEAGTQFEIEQWKGYWHVTYVGMAVTWLGTVAVLAMYLQSMRERRASASK